MAEGILVLAVFCFVALPSADNICSGVQSIAHPDLYCKQINFSAHGFAKAPDPIHIEY